MPVLAFFVPWDRQTWFRLMLQRYMGARMTIPVPVGAPFGAVVFTCHSWCANDGEDPVFRAGRTYDFANIKLGNQPVYWVIMRDTMGIQWGYHGIF